MPGAKILGRRPAADAALGRGAFGPAGRAAKLLADRFIDDNRYAEAFVRDKIRLSGWGARKIRTSLRLKGIAAAIIDEALARLDPANQSERLRTQLEKSSD